MSARQSEPSKGAAGSGSAPATVVVVHAHPYPRRSRANRVLLAAVKDVPGVAVTSLYDRYPDFAIDVDAEQAALRAARAVVWQSPFYWYGVPALLQHWFEKVLEEGFAHGPGGDALAGKPLLWVTTTGTAWDWYGPEHSFEAFTRPIEQTARFCKMRWEEPIVVHGADTIDDAALAAHAKTYRDRVAALAGEREVA
mgnify:CR=1 FL=1